MSTENTSESNEHLNFYEYFSQIPVPESESSGLNNKVFTTNEGQLEQIKYLEQISKVNIFVGPNNSGKSRFLREVLKALDIQPLYIPKSKQTSLLEELKRLEEYLFRPVKSMCIVSPDRRRYFKLRRINGFVQSSTESWYQSLITYLENEDLFSFRNSLYNGDKTYFDVIQNKDSKFVVYNEDERREVLLGEQGNADFIKYFAEGTQELFRLVNEIRPEFKSTTKIYTPNVRTLKNFTDNQGFNAYNINYESNDNIVTSNTRSKYEFDSTIKINDGQKFYFDLLNKRNSTNEKLEKLQLYQKFLSTMFFAGEEVSLISDVTEHQVKIKIGKEEDRLIHQLGDGVQQMIMLTFPLFFNEYGMMVIEEPEMWVHPGLQKTLMEIFTSDTLAKEYGYSKNFIYFIATHSNHILDVQKNSDLISIFSVEKKNNNETPDLIINEEANKDTKILDLIGVSNSSVYLANCAIWVEGSTDKLYLGKYLKETIEHYKKKEDGEEELHQKLNKFVLIEGTHYTFAYSAGNNIFNLDFSDGQYDDIQKNVIVKYLTNKSLVVVDNDVQKNPELKKALKEALDENFIELEVNEVENLLSEEVIVESMLETWVSLQRIQVKDASFKEKLKQKISGISLNKDNKLGKLLSDKIDDKFKTKYSINQKKSFGSGSIIEKTEFCNNAIQHIKWENMTEDAKDVSKKILLFILKSNLM